MNFLNNFECFHFLLYVGGTCMVALWLVGSSLDQTLRVRALSGDIASERTLTLALERHLDVYM